MEETYEKGEGEREKVSQPKEDNGKEKDGVGVIVLLLNSGLLHGHH